MNTKLTDGDKAMIRMVQGNWHVGVSQMEVARYWLKRSQQRDCSKAFRFAITRYGLKVHLENFKLYAQVMTGKL